METEFVSIYVRRWIVELGFKTSTHYLTILLPTIVSNVYPMAKLWISLWLKRLFKKKYDYLKMKRQTHSF